MLVIHLVWKLQKNHYLRACLFRLISPFMPFITEELYHRLHPSTSKVTSICVQDYPKNLKFRDEALEKQFEFVQKISGMVRSLRSDYNLPNNFKADLYIRIFSDSSLAKEVSLFKDVLATSAYANKVVVAEKDDLIPEGCAIVTVSDKCAAHLMLKGIIDPTKEVEKVAKKQEVLKSSLEKLKKSMEIKDYAKKVPKEVQEANAEKVAQMETEIVRLSEAMTFLKAM